MTNDDQTRASGTSSVDADEQPTSSAPSWMSSIISSVLSPTSAANAMASNSMNSDKLDDTSSRYRSSGAQLPTDDDDDDEDDLDDEDNELATPSNRSNSPSSITANPQAQSDRESRKQLWQQVYSYMGSNLTGMRLSLPIWLFEPTTTLTRMAETFEFSDLLDRAATAPDPLLRDSLVTAFVVSTFSNTLRVRKPFNPVLGETYEFLHPISDMKLYAEQVSHHPPISASFVQGNGWEAGEVTNVQAKFQGNSMELNNSGDRYVKLNNYGDRYTWTTPMAIISNLFVGKTYIDHQGSFEIKNENSGTLVKLEFPKSGWFNSNRYEVSGDLYDPDGERILHFRGAWNRYLDSSPVEKEDAAIEKQEGTDSSKGKYPNATSSSSSITKEATSSAIPATKSSPSSSSSLPTKKNSHQSEDTTNDSPFPSLSSSTSSESLTSSAPPQSSTSTTKPAVDTTSADRETDTRVTVPLVSSASILPPPMPTTSTHPKGPAVVTPATDGCNRLWVAGAHLLTEKDGGVEGPFANCTKFTKRTVAFDADYALELPPTDSRLRPDRIALERGDHTTSAEEKLRIEQLQRDRRAAVKAAVDEGAEPPKPKYFRKVSDDNDDKWEPTGTYWTESRSFMDDDEKRQQASLW